MTGQTQSLCYSFCFYCVLHEWYWLFIGVVYAIMNVCLLNRPMRTEKGFKKAAASDKAEHFNTG